MSALPAPSTAPADREGPLSPESLLAALRQSAGSLVDGVVLGTAAGAPEVGALARARAEAVLAAWTGARLHAGTTGLLAATDADVALLVGDWCYAQSLRALADGGDLAAIGVLATAIGACAALLGDAEITAADRPARLEAVWSGVTATLAPSS